MGQRGTHREGTVTRDGGSAYTFVVAMLLKGGRRRRGKKREGSEVIRGTSRNPS